MDSTPHGVPLFATKATPHSPAELYPKPKVVSPLSNSSGSSFPIRAPPTVDSDSEFSITTTKGQKHSITSSSSDISDSGSEYEGFVSGEDEFDSASERPFAADPNDEILEDTHYVEEFVVSRPNLTDPDEEIVEQSGGVKDHVVSRPFVSKPVMPFAQLSGDSDEDALGIEEVEDDGFSGAVRVPGNGGLERINSAPKVRIWEVEEGEEYESEFEPALDVEVVEDSALERIVAEDYAGEGFVSAELIEDRGPDDTEEAKVESLVESPDDIMFGNSELDGDEKHLVEEIQAPKNVEQQEIGNNEHITEERDRVDLGDNAALGINAGTQIEMVINWEEEQEAAEGSASTATGIDKESHVIDNPSESKPLQANKELFSTDDGDLVVSETKDIILTASRVESIDSAIRGNGIQYLDHSEISEPYHTPETKYFGNGHTTEGDLMEYGFCSKFNSLGPLSLDSSLNPDEKVETEVEPDRDGSKLEEKNEFSVSDDDAEPLIFGVSDTAKQGMNGLEQRLDPTSFSGAGSSHNHLQMIDGQIMAESDEEADTECETEIEELFDSAALAALLKAATGAGSDGGSVKFTSADSSTVFSLKSPADLSALLSSPGPIPQPNRPNIFTPSVLTARGESEEYLSEEEKKKLEKMQVTTVKFLRLVQRVGRSPEDSIAAQVLYRLVLAAGRPSHQAFSLESAKRTAMELEAEGNNDINFSLNILIIGKTGVGKSATINSIFGEEKATVDAFGPATNAVREIIGTIDGVKVRVLDTPGLRSSFMEQSFNLKVLASIKNFTKKCPPDVILYVDRLDTQTRDLNDLPLLRSITSSLGSSILHNAIITLTHAASTPPDGLSGSPLSYEVFVAQQSRIIQQLISQAAGDLRMMNPVCLVENHPLCQENGDGQKVLPNGESWIPQLLLLCYSMKILSEVNSVAKTQDPFDYQKLFGFQGRSPPLSYLLSSQLQPQAHPKLSADHGGADNDSDIELLNFSDTDQESEDEYDELPPFKPLRRSQIAKLSKEHKKAYFEEYDYRVKLLQKKQLTEEVKRLREMKRKGKDGGNDYEYMGGDEEQENGSPATVPVPLPDMVLPLSFDGDNPTYRYRFLEPTSHLLARPVMELHGWDHDCGYEGVSIEESLAIAGLFPAVIAVQVTKDKKEFNIHLDSAVAAKHGENGSTMAGFDIQTIGKQLAYILKGETKIKNFKMNKTAAGVSLTFLGENVATGLKIEDQIAFGKRLVLLGCIGAIRSQGDVAHGANFEVRLREKDFPIGQDQSTLGLSLMRWRGDLMWGCNFQSQFSIGRSSKMAVRAGLNNKSSGQISVKTSSSEQLQIALVGVLPFANAIFRKLFSRFSEKHSAY
ncbi:translocase of chloroplast 159, chloroplastic [Cornus florida]|uniref:translocase of chloroplast 159, chloroplastic n=1 Tax=Cornus florida TaxID=4283 RepID=UPI00289E8BF8|nr:translocase of chloroplast 159, chloroplastic [Cornus florida]